MLGVWVNFATVVIGGLVGTLLRGGINDEALLEALRAAVAAKPRRHGFMDEIGDREVRRMNEIGG